MTGGGGLRGVSSMATRQLLAALLDEYTRSHGVRVELIAIGGVDAAKRVRAGEAFDFVVLASNAIDDLAAEGRVDATSVRPVANSSIAVAVPAGAPKPDLSNEESVRAVVLHAAAIAYSTGPSGTHLLRLLDRWGVADTVAPRLVQAPPGVPVASLVASGRAALGFQQLSELAGVPGIEVAGALPEPIQSTTTFTAAVCTTSRDVAATRDCIAFLTSKATAEVKRRFGLAPP